MVNICSLSCIYFFIGRYLLFLELIGIILDLEIGGLDLGVGGGDLLLGLDDLILQGGGLAVLVRELAVQTKTNNPNLYFFNQKCGPEPGNTK